MSPQRLIRTHEIIFPELQSPEVLYVKELVESGESEKALDVAQQLLLREDFSPVELAHLNRLICCARQNTGDVVGALPPGRLALQMAEQLELWDLYGYLCLEVGMCYLVLRDTARAKEVLSAFFMHEEDYQRADFLTPRLWGSLARCWDCEGKHKEARVGYQRALDGLMEQGIVPLVLQSFRYLLANLHVSAPREVPTWLRELRGYVRRHRTESEALPTYYIEVGKYALHRKRYWRAFSLGLRGRDLSGENARTAFEAHMLLAEAARGLGYLQDSLGYALAARVIALRSGHYALEFNASHLIFRLLDAAGPETLSSLDRTYLAQGIDIGSYVAFLQPKDPLDMRWAFSAQRPAPRPAKTM